MNKIKIIKCITCGKKLRVSKRSLNKKKCKLCKLFIKKCIICGKEFKSKLEKTRYCGMSCINKVTGRKYGALSHVRENRIASTLRYKNIFKPQQVCDRIVIVNHKILFIEIKSNTAKLRPEQERFRKLVKDRYKIIRGF